MMNQGTIEKKRAVGYIRVSTTEQADKGYSLDAQTQTIREYCLRENLDLKFVYADRGKSGKSIKGRVEMQRLLQDAEEGNYDCVVVWKISRVARNLVDLLEIVNLLQKKNIAFYSISEQFQVDTSSGRFMLQIMAATNEMERNQIAENVKLSMTKLSHEGYWISGKAPLGFDNIELSNEKKGLAINKKESGIIQLIFNEAAKGKGYRAIANQLNRIGYKTKFSNSFSSVAIRDILKNPVYIGKIRYNKYEKWSDKRRNGLSKNVFIVDGKHEGIIDNELWEKVQGKLALSSKNPAWNHKGASILTGILKCPECGSPMVINNVTNKLKDGTKKVIRYYSCSQFRNKGAAVCHANSIKSDVAEEQVASKLSAVIQQSEVLDAVIENMNKKMIEEKEPFEKNRKSIQSRIEVTEKNIQRFLELITQAPEIAEDLHVRIKELENNRYELLNQEREMENRLNQTRKPISKKETQRVLDLLGIAIKDKEKKELKEIYKTFIDKITFDKSTKEVNVHLVFNKEILRKLNSNLEKEPSSSLADEGSFTLSESTYLIL
ncbi:recombinase family protein [Carnobacterium jeotgali]|uniref:recombinase family protein n=1 Tax=Carnobacterium jeotgali TaxID=545534 RepID=UPI000689DEE6|nr:recombinase family protein [Carnobacterium jeotgali]